MTPIAPVLESIAATPDERSAAPLIHLIRAIRPRKLEAPGAVTQRLRAMIGLLRCRPHLASGLRNYLDGVFASRLQRALFADLGILGNQSVSAAIFQRIGAKLLPPAYDETYLRDLFAVLMHEAGDRSWLHEIPESVLAELLQVIRLGADNQAVTEVRIEWELLEALRILSFRLAAIGVEPDFIRYDTQAANRESPFVAQTDEVQAFIGNAFAALSSPEQGWPDAAHLEVLLGQCEAQLKRIRLKAHQGGASVALTYEGFRAAQIIQRMRRLTELTTPDASEIQQQKRITFFKELMRYEEEKNSIRALLTQVTDLLALQVTEHASRTGEHYVTSSRSEYLGMFRAASGAGVIVAFMALLKLFIAKAKLPPLWEALGFSLNYGLGFVVVHLFHFTIATKQPAMTAATIAASLEDGDKRAPPLEKLENLIVDVIRSQFIAIVGNVVAAFLTCLAIGAAWTWVFGAPEIDREKALHLLHDIDPLRSLALPHAAIAGVCLYLAGLISGYYDNKCVYARIPQRIRQLHSLRTLFGERGRDRIATYLENNLGALAGNLTFGFMLGCMGTIGFLLGLPLDIRHVTFGAANFAYALMALDFQVPWQVVLTCALGVLGVGVVNLGVSFSLALFTALKSRQIRFAYSKPLFGRVLRRFLRRPWEFFLPGRATANGDRSGS